MTATKEVQHKKVLNICLVGEGQLVRKSLRRGEAVMLEEFCVLGEMVKDEVNALEQSRQ